MLWDSSLNCGVEQVDNEHKELFRIAGELSKVAKTEKSIEKSRMVLEFLGNYVVEHFAHEEALMYSCNYPNTDEHEKLHKKFVQTFLDLKKKFNESGEPLSVSTQIHYATMSWLVNHIQIIDMRFVKYYIEFQFKEGN